jgi:hypothetical protein
MLALNRSPGRGLLIPPFSITIAKRRFQIFTRILCLTLVCWATRAQAQGFDATDLRKPAELAAGWLVHAGDEPAYARPDFDDSHWAPFNAQTDNLHNLFPNSRPEVVWYRLHVKVDPRDASLSLDESNLASAFEIYSSGVKVIQVGSVTPFVPATYSAHILRRIPVVTGSVVLALRVHISAGEWTEISPGLISSHLLLGDEGVLREHIWFTIAAWQELSWFNIVAFFGLFVGALLLYSAQRKQKEYLWLSLWAFCLFILIGSSIFLNDYHSISLYWTAYYSVCALVFWFISVHMYCAFVQRPVGWRLNLYLVLTGALWAVGATKDWLGSDSLIYGRIVIGNIAILTVIVLPAILISRLRRGNRDAGILLLPHLLFGANLVIQFVADLMSLVPALRPHAAALGRSTRWHAGPFVIDLFPLCWLLSAFAFALIILLRSNRVSRERGLLDAEVASAREVQQVILPEAIQSIPGFRIESVYEPAREVGGDFFQILPAADSGLLLVVGDVAGKGLPAAMLVSLLVGTIRTAAEDTDAPDKLLSKMNERLIGRTRGGFSTALVAHITASGSVTIANAGHLSPYLDGKEVELPGALPLGIASGMRYESSRIRMEPSGRLTFYSDGVIEAQDKSGQLFGFDRARGLSMQPAATIVEAAKAFGQKDDITVITVERVAVEVRPTVEQTTPIFIPAQ